MADWFKFYENDLDETRLQYAIAKMLEVTPVWVGILSECCRHKSDTIRWGSNEIELFGFARRLNISLPKVNEAVNVLVEIDYIERGENTLKVLKWTSKQSEYCQKKLAKTPDSVGTVSGQCRPRGEERRGEKKRVQRQLASDEPKPASDAEWLEGLKTNPAYAGIDVGREYGKMCSWCDVNRKQPSRRRFINWLNRAERPLSAVSGTPADNKTQTVYGLTKIIEAKTKLADQLKNKHAAEGPLSTDWDSEQARKDHARIRGEIKQLNQQLAGMA